MLYRRVGLLIAVDPQFRQRQRRRIHKADRGRRPSSDRGGPVGKSRCFGSNSEGSDKRERSGCIGLIHSRSGRRSDFLRGGDMSTSGAPEDGADRNADRSTDEGIISFLVASTRGSRYSASRRVLGARSSGSFGLGAVRQLLLRHSHP